MKLRRTQSEKDKNQSIKAVSTAAIRNANRAKEGKQRIRRGRPKQRKKEIKSKRNPNQ